MRSSARFDRPYEPASCCSISKPPRPLVLCCPDEDLIVLGDGACVGAGAYLAAHELTRNGKFKRGPIVVGADCTVGPSARLTSYVTVEAGCSVPALVCALPGQTFRRGSQSKGDQTPMPSSGMPPGPPVLPREQDEADDGATPGRHQRPRANGGAGARTVLGAGLFATPTVAAAGTARAALTAAPWQALALALVLGCAALTVAAFALHARQGPVLHAHTHLAATYASCMSLWHMSTSLSASSSTRAVGEPAERSSDASASPPKSRSALEPVHCARS